MFPPLGQVGDDSDKLELGVLETGTMAGGTTSVSSEVTAPNEISL